MNPKIRHALLVSTLSLGTMGALALTGCSESDDPVSSEQMQEADQSIAEIAAADESFSTLVAALEAANLVETLAGEGNFTVFAPTDDAFAALPEGTLDALLADPEGDLAQILTYHVIGSKVLAEDVVSLTEATTLEGTKITIEVVDGDVILNGTVKVVSTDIMANNGVIHVIDGVLLPTAEVDPKEDEVDPKEDEVDTSTLTITEIAAADENFSTLVTALQAAELDGVLNGSEKYTVFAPTNDAFDALPEGTLEALLADPKGDLADILLYHVVAGKVDASTVVGLSNALTVNGAKVGIEVVDGKVILNGNAEVTVTDIMAKNGIIHVIDAVILPSNAPKNIVETALADEQFSTLVTALTEAKLVETLSNEDAEFTVFAPTNDAFAALPEGTLDALLADPEGDLKDILLYHVVGAEVDAATVVGLSNAVTVNGAKVGIEVVGGKVILNGNAEVTVTDIQTTNGIIHVIDAVILPENGPKNIVETALADEQFSTLVTALTEAKLVETLSNEDAEFTVFAPTNDAFAALPEGTLDALLADPEGDLKDILLYHVVGAEVDAATVVGLNYATTVEGSRVTIEVVEGKVILNGNSEVTVTDIQTTNGIIHVIDAVILPSNAPQSIAEIAAGNADLETLTAAVDAAGLTQTLTDAGEYTVFAPTDAAFAALPEGTLDALLADPEGDLKNILLYHVVGDEVNSSEVVTLTSATSLETTEISIEVVNGKVILDGEAEVIITDIVANNGIVHVIDAVITP